MTKHFQAGYILDSIAAILMPELKARNLEIIGLLEHITTFDVVFPDEHLINFNDLHPVLATLNNIINRGLPTKSPVLLEQLFNKLGYIQETGKEHELVYEKLNVELDYDKVFKLLHIIEPNLTIQREQYGTELDSPFEWYFLDNTLAQYEWVKQILQPQRSFATIDPDFNGGQRVDFSYSSPYHIVEKHVSKQVSRNFIIEVDGNHHTHFTNRIYDKYRDDASEEADFETFRVSNLQYQEEAVNPVELFGKASYQIYRDNFNRDISQDKILYALIFTPLAVARIQKTLIEYLLSENFEFRNTLKIAVIERDVPCGVLAIKSFEDYIKNINALIENPNERYPIPEIELSIYSNPKWKLSEDFNESAYQRNEVDFEDRERQFDIILDHSILRRTGIYKENTYQSKNAIKIRSSHFADKRFGQRRRTYCADPIKYKKLVKKRGDGTLEEIEELEPHTEFLLQNIFRKRKFREGQLAIMSRALRQQPVIGLLPTGGGKSLAFQLSAFMQPGLCLVIDPIKSLMEDQVRGLKKVWIDNCDYINSNLEREKKNRRLIDFKYGESQFFFVSPERFVMTDFRKVVNAIDAKWGLAFSYCVIDEVHCVSEWGHDFRTTYLMLGKNAQKYTKTRNGNPVTLFGLTATASFDVLADVERELDIESDDVADAIVENGNVIRPELFFRVEKIGLTTNRLTELNDDFMQIPNNIGNINNTATLTQSLQHHEEEFIDETNQAIKTVEDLVLPEDVAHVDSDNTYSIIFCPHKTGPFGVDTVYQSLNTPPTNKGFFYSTDDDGLNEEIQENFQKFLDGDIHHMGCTKAFGMGIDKDDVRATYHYVYPNSLESFVQEAGRAGRDGKVAESVILYSPESTWGLSYKALYKRTPNTKDENEFAPLFNKWDRKKIRKNLILNFIDKKPIEIIFSSQKQAFNEIDKLGFSNDINNHLKQFIIEKNQDKGVHEYFHGLSYKGRLVEQHQFYSLFNNVEFNLPDGMQQDTFKVEFENAPDGKFSFIMGKEKVYKKNTDEICALLSLNPDEVPQPDKQNKIRRQIITDQLRYSRDFYDFVLRLEEMWGGIIITNLNTLKHLKYKYNRDRKNNDTGRLIYRMHSMGLLEDYTIDYRSGLYHCRFIKRASIENYIGKIQKFLSRYLSENAVNNKIEKLENWLNKSLDRPLIGQILQCLYFLTDFSYRVVADKRKEATDEMDRVVRESLDASKISSYKAGLNGKFPNVSDALVQNFFIKNEIYYYFNAKYARIDYQFEGKPYSLYSDINNVLYGGNKTTDLKQVLNKYLDVLKEGAAQQNNYKHMIGSCRKLNQNLLLAEDKENDWLLRLLRGFSMFCVNNTSYNQEAISFVEVGFLKLFHDTKYCNKNYNKIAPIFEGYFKRLEENIDQDNEVIECVKTIREKLMQQFYTEWIDEFERNFSQLKQMDYAL